MATKAEKNFNDDMFGKLTMVRYDIDGNIVRAFYDENHDLVFVIDDTVTPDKPNAMLVIDAHGGRKWDDVLANDYDVMVDSVRPKKDNKYQKLDIEYQGLDRYDNLIGDFNTRADIGPALAAVNEFRASAAARIASERLAAADVAADNARETMRRADASVAELESRLKDLRAKLRQLRRNVGREPTKQSAAKILRTESQIDAASEKLARARRRYANARRRLAVAADDADAARAVLARHGASVALRPVAPTPMAVDAAPTPMVMNDDAGDLVMGGDVPQFRSIDFDDDVDDVNADYELTDNNDEFEQDNNTTDQGAEKMADEPVKPLFDKDPEILDEEIAFKPIDFNVGPDVVAGTRPAASMSEYRPADVAAPAGPAPSPLSFVPPTQPAAVSDATSTYAQSNPGSVLDSLTPTSAVPEYRPAESMPMGTGYGAPATPVAPTMGATNTQSSPVMPMSQPAPTMTQSMDDAAPRPMGAAAPVARPVSPVGGNNGTAGNVTARSRPTLLYYVMLIALIVMSIFTLWMYQKSSKDSSVPDVATTAPETANADALADVNANPFLDLGDAPTPAADNASVVESDVVTVTETVTDVAPVVPDDVPAPTPEPEPVVEPVAAPELPVESPPAVTEPVPATPTVTEPQVQPVADEPVNSAAPAPAQPDAEPVVDKPAYNVSQNEKMFVADATYETDASAQVAAPDQMCDDGSAPDANGCCAGEELTDIGGEYVCCPLSGGDCFPPLL